MAGLCSTHKKADPKCRLCSAHPRDLFPDWDRKLEAAVEAGTTKCAHCGFEYFRTLSLCPQCSTKSHPVVLLEVSSCRIELASELLWFVNEWCKELGWVSPQIVHGSELSFTIYAYQPATNEPDTAE
jgi:hypothetical protein